MCAGTVAECYFGTWECTRYMLLALLPRFEEAERSCDQLDNDCDGQTDEDCVCPDTPGCEAPPAPVIINEIFYDAVGADNDVFVELHGEPGTSLTGYRLEGIGGDTGSVYRTITLTGTIPANGYFLIATSNGAADLKAKAQQIANVDFQNGPDAVYLRDGGGAMVDAIAYADDWDAILPNLGEGLPSFQAEAGQSLNRSDFVDTNDNYSDFRSDDPSPGADNR